MCIRCIHCARTEEDLPAVRTKEDLAGIRTKEDMLSVRAKDNVREIEARAAFQSCIHDSERGRAYGCLNFEPQINKSINP